MRKRIYSKINRKFDNLQTSFFIRTEPTTRDNLTRGATNTVGRGFSPRREHDPSLISARGSGKIILPCPLPVIRGCSSQTLPPRDCRESRLHCRYGFAPFPKEFDFNLYYILCCLLPFACCFPALPHRPDVIGGQDFPPSAGRLYGTHGKNIMTRHPRWVSGHLFN